MTNITKNNRKALALLSLILIGFSIYQIVNIVLMIPTLNAINPADLDPALHFLIPIITTFTVFCLFIPVVLMIILAAKGLHDAKTPTESRYHIVLALLVTLLYALDFGGTFVQFFTDPTAGISVVSLLLGGIHTVIMGAYLFCAQSVRRSH